MKTTLKLTLYCLVLMALGLSSCSKDDFTDTAAYLDLIPNDQASTNEVRSIFAKTLVKSLEQEDVRSYFHESMQKVHASDFEWVYLAEKDKIIYNNKRLAEVLKENAEPQILEQYGENFFDLITEISPLLAVSLPNLDDSEAPSWDINVVPSTVAVLEGSSYSYKEFLQNGASKAYSRAEIETIKGPILSVWDAEAYYLIDENGVTPYGHHIDDYMPSTTEGKSCFSGIKSNLNGLFVYQITQKRYSLIEHNTLLQLYNNCLGLTFEDEAIAPRGSMCARDMETLDERLAQFKINNWGVFTNIRNQFLESKYVFHGDVLYATRNSFGTVTSGAVKYVSPSKKKKDLLDCSGSSPCRGRFITASYRIWTDWDEEEFGSPYHISWAEVDNGSTTVSLSFPFTAKFKLSDTVELSAGVTVGFSRTGSAIVALGSAPVFYCDAIMRDNNTGSITFRSN